LNRDQIVDFVPGQNKLTLGQFWFSSLPIGGTVASNHFVAAAGAVAADADDFLIYDTATGLLSYDPDGNGPQAAIGFVELVGMPALTGADIQVQA
jgi:Ca2+-binding RTX toxin-like protein